MTRSKPARRFRHTRRGVVVSLAGSERKALASVLEQFRQLLFSGADPNLACLEPPACLDDPDTELEYRAMAANRLLRHRLEAIETVEAGLQDATLDPDMVAAWMQTLNGIRLYLGERLGIADNPEPESSKHAEKNLMLVYEWLGGLLEQLVEAAAEGLPPGSDDD